MSKKQTMTVKRAFEILDSLDKNPNGYKISVIKEAFDVVKKHRDKMSA